MPRPIELTRFLSIRIHPDAYDRLAAVAAAEGCSTVSAYARRLLEAGSQTITGPRAGKPQPAARAKRPTRGKRPRSSKRVDRPKRVAGKKRAPGTKRTSRRKR